MAVLKQISPTRVPVAPKDSPSKYLPSSRARSVRTSLCTIDLLGRFSNHDSLIPPSTKNPDRNLALDVRTDKVTDAMQKLGMKEGFDVAPEMSKNPRAFDDILKNMFHGGKIALLGIMPGSAAIDWNTVVFSALTIKGIYRQEMVRDLVQNERRDPERP